MPGWQRRRTATLLTREDRARPAGQRVAATVRMLSRMLAIAVVVFGITLSISLIRGVVRDKQAVAPRVAATEPVSVVDVARGVDAGTLATVVRLREDERVTAIDDQPVANDFAAGAAISARALGAGTYLDLTVTSPHGQRRVLVLMH